MVQAVRFAGRPRFLPLASSAELKAKLDEMPLQMVGEFYPSHLEFVSDEPTNSKRLFADALAQKISAVRQSLVIETPDFAAGRRVSKALTSLLEQKKSVVLLTVESPDHSATISYSILSLGSNLTGKKLKSKGAEVYFKQETLSPETLPLLEPKSEEVPWGTHCKASIFDRKNVLLGSFNYDILSEEHNSEAGIYFLNAPELASALYHLENSRPYRKQ
jgi:phosphatidylserine/phosphatidylglycerophosphate/cardiolipin synthase-like enzyme